MSAPPAGDAPRPQYLGASHVMDAIAVFGRGRVHELTPTRVLVLAVLAGGFLTAGALFSVLLSNGIETEGLRLLLLGLGFSAGFFFVVLSDAVLFTEANVVLPTTLLDDRRLWPRVVRFWSLAWLGNLFGAWLFGTLVAAAQLYGTDVLDTLAGSVDSKLAYEQIGTATAWWQVVLSGVLANWLVGMAAFFAFMGRTIIGKYVPVFLAVSLFVAAGFQHSPANMAYIALHLAHGGEGDWLSALAWNLIPAGIGNMLGAAGLVAAPFWFVFHRAGDGTSATHRDR